MRNLRLAESIRQKNYELEEHLTITYNDNLRHVPLQVRRDIPMMPFPTSLASTSLEEVRRVIRKVSIENYRRKRKQ